MNEPNKSGPNTAQILKRTLLVTLSAGCLTFLVAGGAILAGILLDLRYDSLPKWTLVLLLGSAPFTLGGLYLLVRRVLKRGREEASGGEAEEGDSSSPLEQ